MGGSFLWKVVPLYGPTCNQNSNKVEFQVGPSVGIYISDMVPNIKTTKFLAKATVGTSLYESLLSLCVCVCL